MKYVWSLLFLCVGLGFPPRTWAEDQAVVILPVVDLRRNPELPSVGRSDADQETQLLYGERVTVLSSSGAWSRVEAGEQTEFTHHSKWEGYPGWVLGEALRRQTSWEGPFATVKEKWILVWDAPKKGTPILSLPLGSRLLYRDIQKGRVHLALWDGREAWAERKGLRLPTESPTPKTLRKNIIATAKLLIGDPYIWGGLSPRDPTGWIPLTGVDCSGLVYLCYRVHGVVIPRDAQEQYYKAKPLHRRELRPGDLVFSAPATTPKKITHVALYAGGEDLIEAPQAGFPVRRITFREKTGTPLKGAESGQTLQQRVVYFGRLLPD